MSRPFNPGPAASQAFQQVMCDPYDLMQSSVGLYTKGENYRQVSTGGNFHETFRIDRYDNIYGGHTTIDLGKRIGDVHLDW